MADMIANIDIRPLVKTAVVHLRVKGMREFRTRLWIGTQIIRFGVWIAGMRSKVELDAKE